MKFNLKGVYIITIQGKELTRLTFSGLISANSRPNKGETVGLNFGGIQDNSPEDFLEVKKVEHTLHQGILMPPDIELEDYSYDIYQEMLDGGGGQTAALKREKASIERAVIPAFKKQGFTEFKWYT
jgi:hypothetical protein